MGGSAARRRSVVTGFGAGPLFFLGRGEHARRQLRYAYSPRWPYRVLAWVPTRPLKCTGKWERWSGETVGSKNICGAGLVGGDGMSSRPVGAAGRLTVKVDAETDDGLVESGPAGIDCGTITPWNATPRRGTACAASFGMGSMVTLRPLTSVGLTPQIVHRTGCSTLYTPDPRGQPWFIVELAENTEVTATFRLVAPASGAP